WKYCQGDRQARRPPELLTRDHVARCIVREIKEGRGSPHGGVFLDISWIKKKSRMLRNTSRKSCRVCIINSSSSPMSTSPPLPWKLDRRCTTSWAASVFIRRLRCLLFPACSLLVSAVVDSMEQTVSAVIPCQTCWFSENAPESLLQR